MQLHKRDSTGCSYDITLKLMLLSCRITLNCERLDEIDSQGLIPQFVQRWGVIDGGFVVCLRNSVWFIALTASCVNNAVVKENMLKKAFLCTKLHLSATHWVAKHSSFPIWASKHLWTLAAFAWGGWIGNMYGWGSPQPLLSGFKSCFKHGDPSCIALKTHCEDWFESISATHVGFVAAACTSIISQQCAALLDRWRAFVKEEEESGTRD